VAPTKPPEVLFDYPIEKTVTDFEDFIGRTVAFDTAVIRSQVTGYLDEIKFKDGADVKKDEVLFVIDPSQLQAQVESAKAVLVQAKATQGRAKATLEQAQRDYERLKNLREGSRTPQEWDKAVADKAVAEAALAEAAAAIGKAEADLKLAQVNLGYTRVIAPFAGRISNRQVDRGNLVKANETILTTLVALDPMYVYFDVDERTMLRIRRLIHEGKVKSSRVVDIPVKIGLADEEGFSQTGVINFVDNRVDPGTGTLRVRAEVKNPTAFLSPGLFVRVRLPVGDPHPAILVREEAIGTDQGQKYVFVINDADEVVYRSVKVGQLVDGRRVIETGLSTAERVIVSGLQRVRAGVKVSPKPAEAPASN
jgi:RND family efflux transporter MFP subunit